MEADSLNDTLINPVLDHIPEDVFLHIFSFVSTPALFTVAANVCSKWRKMCAYPVAERPFNKQEECTDLSALANATLLTVTTILKCLGYTFKYSTKMKITACFEIDDDKLYKLAINNPQFTHLILYGCKHITSDGIEKACKVLPNLEYLDVRECSRITQYTINKLEKFLEVAHGASDPFADHPEVFMVPPKGAEKIFEECFKTLKLSEKPTVVQMKKSYLKLSKEYHPDKQFNLWDKRVAHEKFIALDQAYKFLSSMYL